VKRAAKLAAGFLLAVGGAYVVVGEQMAGVSADAVINAQVVTVRAPVDGELTLQVRNLGAHLGQGEAIGRLEDPRPDETRLVDLRRMLAAAEADLGRLLDLTRALVASRAVLEGQAADYARGRVQQLEARLAEARAALEGTQSRLREADATLRRASDLTGCFESYGAGADGRLRLG
jgi:multidrug efflux pump subunit AcrA (membrane-fusion protein)